MGFKPTAPKEKITQPGQVLYHPGYGFAQNFWQQMAPLLATSGRPLFPGWGSPPGAYPSVGRSTQGPMGTAGGPYGFQSGTSFGAGGIPQAYSLGLSPRPGMTLTRNPDGSFGPGGGGGGMFGGPPGGGGMFGQGGPPPFNFAKPGEPLQNLDLGMLPPQPGGPNLADYLPPGLGAGIATGTTPGMGRVDRFMNTEIFDPMDSFRKLAPAAIGEAMGMAGFSGNRYGTGAMREAGRVSGEILAQLAPEASRQRIQQMGIQANLLGSVLPASLATGSSNQRYLSDLRNQWAQTGYQDWKDSQLGYLPMLLPLLGSIGNPGYMPQQTQNFAGNPGTLGYMDMWAQMLGDWASAISGTKGLFK